MRLETRYAAAEDAAIVGGLIDDMDQHYRGEGQSRGAAAAAAMVQRSFADAEGARFIIAFADDEPAGLACFGVLRPGALLEGLVFLKDVFVRAPYRQHGVGRVLMSAVAQFAIEKGLGRIDLNTSHGNTAARRLYDSLGGGSEDVLRYKFEGESLRQLARR